MYIAQLQIFSGRIDCERKIVRTIASSLRLFSFCNRFGMSRRSFAEKTEFYLFLLGERRKRVNFTSELQRYVFVRLQLWQHQWIKLTRFSANGLVSPGRWRITRNVRQVPPRRNRASERAALLAAYQKERKALQDLGSFLVRCRGKSDENAWRNELTQARVHSSLVARVVPCLHKSMGRHGTREKLNVL